MKKDYKKILIKLFLIIAFLFATYLFINDYISYALLVLTIFMAGTFILISATKTLKDPTEKYKITIKEILKVYDSVLVESKELPNVKGKNIILVTKMEDLIDAQIELRKPIYYYKQVSTCSFTLFDQEQVIAYILKEEESILSPLEIKIKEIQLQEKRNNIIDESILEQISKTTIVKLPNEKTYKVSPIKKKSEEPIEIL